jgi:hypothetical protein
MRRSRINVDQRGPPQRAFAPPRYFDDDAALFVAAPYRSAATNDPCLGTPCNDPVQRQIRLLANQAQPKRPVILRRRYPPTAWSRCSASGRFSTHPKRHDVRTTRVLQLHIGTPPNVAASITRSPQIQRMRLRHILNSPGILSDPRRTEMTLSCTGRDPMTGQRTRSCSSQRNLTSVELL